MAVVAVVAAAAAEPTAAESRATAGGRAGARGLVAAGAAGAADDFLNGGDLNDFVRAVRREKPAIIGFSSVTPTAPGVTRLSQLCRQRFPDIILIQGGVHSTVFADELLLSGEADVIVHNEGEVTTVELVRALASGGDLSGVLGISYLADGEVVHLKISPTFVASASQTLTTRLEIPAKNSRMISNPMTTTTTTKRSVVGSPMRSSKGKQCRCDIC